MCMFVIGALEMHIMMMMMMTTVTQRQNIPVGVVTVLPDCPDSAHRPLLTY